MTDRDMNNQSQGRQSQNDDDWDWYYYEYRYEPYYGGNYGDRERYGRNYGRSGMDYGRGGYGQNYGQYGQDYGRGYQGDYGSYGTGGNWNRGRYSGVGPRGYQRSDDRIGEDVNDRLTWHGQIDATDIQVDVNDAVVTLTGSVNSRWEKRQAEETADSVSGVKDVQNNLKVNNQSEQNRNQDGSQMSQQNQEEVTESSKRRR